MVKSNINLIILEIVNMCFFRLCLGCLMIESLGIEFVLNCYMYIDMFFLKKMLIFDNII